MLWGFNRVVTLPIFVSNLILVTKVDLSPQKVNLHFYRSVPWGLGGGVARMKGVRFSKILDFKSISKMFSV
jgi:hypothetical protein